MKKTYHGSCHCGAIQFECTLDLSVTSRCNCSICRKTRFWKAIAPAGEFRLIEGEEELTEYSFGNHAIRHCFCRRCGIKMFGQGHFRPIGEFYAVNVAALDDVSETELAAAPIIYENGKHNDGGHAPAETRYL